MFKLKKQFQIINICLFVFLGLLFMNDNYQLMAMNNGHISHSNGHDNNHANFELQARILQDLNLQQTRIVQQIFNARNNNASEEFITNLVRQNVELSRRIATQQIIVHNAMLQQNNRNQSNNTRRR